MPERFLSSLISFLSQQITGKNIKLIYSRIDEFKYVITVKNIGIKI
jgi:hypothetical protein